MKGYKTVSVALLVIITGVLSLLNGDTIQYKELLTPKVFGWIMLVLGVIQIILRVITTSPSPVRRYFVKK